MKEMKEEEIWEPWMEGELEFRCVEPPEPPSSVKNCIRRVRRRFRRSQKKAEDSRNG